MKPARRLSIKSIVDTANAEITSLLTDRSEWLEADGLGGFASGTVTGPRTRRYHALLLTATTPPAGRFVLVNGFDAWLQTASGNVGLSSQRYTPGVVHPDGLRRITSFTAEPWPRWIFTLDDGTQIAQEIFARHGASLVAIRWRRLAGAGAAALAVRPFLSGRDYHALHHENAGFRFDAETHDGRVIWRPYPGVPAVVSLSNASYAPEPTWYRNFLYDEERARGLDCMEDLASPGILRWDLSQHDAIWILAAAGWEGSNFPAGVSAESIFQRLEESERQRRSRFPTRLHRSADAYVVRRGEGETVIAGYPWFTDWGRDTFIALRGLCLATGRLSTAHDILLAWASTVSEGMLPNRFPDHGDAPEFNSVDASLWYVIAVHEYLSAAQARGLSVSARDRQTLHDAIEAILSGYARGTRFGIRADTDGLLAAGQPGVQLTWMDAKVGDWVVTPRIGKPVEVQALWLNALHIGSTLFASWNDLVARARGAFANRFWNEAGGYLYDVVDSDHRPGTTDATFRPNQILAIGGLPMSLLDGERARRVVDAVESRLWTPRGLRSLAPGQPGYIGHYEGDVRARDGAYHQGTAWPWLAGPFVEAWLRVRGNTPAARRVARARFLDPLFQHLDEAGLGHASEIADGDLPHTPRGCPFQAWSLSELMRLHFIVLADDDRTPQATA